MSDPASFERIARSGALESAPNQKRRLFPRFTAWNRSPCRVMRSSSSRIAAPTVASQAGSATLGCVGSTCDSSIRGSRISRALGLPGSPDCANNSCPSSASSFPQATLQPAISTAAAMTMTAAIFQNCRTPRTRALTDMERSSLVLSSALRSVILTEGGLRSLGAHQVPCESAHGRRRPPRPAGSNAPRAGGRPRSTAPPPLARSTEPPHHVVRLQRERTRACAPRNRTKVLCSILAPPSHPPTASRAACVRSQRASCTRFSAPVLRYADHKWFLTVLTAIPRALATSALVRPSPTSRATWTSRVVRGSHRFPGRLSRILTMSITDSGPSRSRVPIHAAQRFRGIPATGSGRSDVRGGRCRSESASSACRATGMRRSIANRVADRHNPVDTTPSPSY